MFNSIQFTYAQNNQNATCSTQYILNILNIIKMQHVQPHQKV